jgi:hypothetical protein
MSTDHLRPGSIVVEEDGALVPDCPHCGAALTRVRARTLAADGSSTFWFGRRYAYACPACNRLLAITHRKGFWMG